MPRGVSAEDAARLQVRLWTPRALQSSLACWFDPSEARTVSGASGDITGVSDLCGRSGFYSDLGSFRPSLGTINRRRAEVYASGDAGRSSVAYDFGDTAGTTQMCVYLVISIDSTSGAWCRPFTLAGSDGSADFNGAPGMALVYRNNATAVFSSQRSGGGLTSTTIPYSTLFLFGVVLTGTQFFHVLDGVDQSSVSLTTGLGSVYFVTSADKHAYTDEVTLFVGTMGERLVVDAFTPTPTRRKIEGYLAHRWGIASRLPASHPYRKSPPLIGG